MLKFWRGFWDNFLNNEAYFIARTRSLVFVVAASGMTFGHDLAEAMDVPHIEKYIKVAAVLCGGLALLMRAGDKTPENVKQLADKVENGS
jgi:hypothetical protein